MLTTYEQAEEDLCQKMFGRSPSLARAGKQCVKCGKGANEFKNQSCAAFYTFSLYCQDCQDEYFEQDSACSSPEKIR